MFKRIVAAAAIAGALSGLVLTAVQQIQISPLIRASEVREAAAKPDAHEAQGWEPRDGGERLAATLVANVVLATGFALLLSAAMSQRRHSGWRAGALWGIAGYAVCFVAPALGLAPELPGVESAPLAARQTWWIAAVSCSAAGLWLAVFAAKPLVRILGIALLFVPHLVGAPSPTGVDASIGDDGRAFIRATYLANAALWLMLGLMVGVLSQPGKSTGTPGRHRRRGPVDVDARTPP
jgi:cobalt transporter subunit CbtA